MQIEKCKYAGQCGWSHYGTYCKITNEEFYPLCDLYQKFDNQEDKEKQELGRRFRMSLEGKSKENDYTKRN